jgi:FtsZ-binding cell division protein ZapB
MDIFDILDNKVKDAVEQKLKLESRVSSLEKEIERLNKDCLDLKTKDTVYKDEISSVLSELDRAVKDLDI